MKKCLWCGEGEYKEVANSATPSYRLELYAVSRIGETQWNVYVAECCGHVQYCRADLVKPPLKAA